MKASPGRGKLSPQVTDEGVGEQQLTGKLPLIRRCAPPSPQGVKAFALGQASKVDFRVWYSSSIVKLFARNVNVCARDCVNCATPCLRTFDNFHK